jgi:DNA repair exonuclease SbcCD ATPase subunit
MFEKVCGLALKNVVIATTRWDMVGNERAVELQQELVTGERYLKPLCDAGANTFGHDNTRGSAQRVMNKLLNNNRIVLQMQEELVAGMTLEQTAAGSQLSADMDALIKKHEAEMKKVREELEDVRKAKDEVWQKFLELSRELAKLKKDVARLTASKEQLKKPPYVLLFLTRTRPHRMFSESSTARGWFDSCHVV